MDLTGLASETYVDSAVANVDLTGLASETYVDSAVANVSVDLTGYATESYVDQANADLTTYVNGGLNNVQISISTTATELSGEIATANSNMQSYVDTANTNMVTYVDALETKILGGANVNLDSLAEVANALSNSNTSLTTVAFTGDYSDLSNRPTITLSGSDLTLDGTTLDLSSVGAVGPQGPTGATGADSTVPGPAGADGADGIQGPQGLKGDTGDTGATGPQGPQGPAGADGADSTVAGPQGPQGIQGPQGNVGLAGSDGADGISITDVSLVAGNLVIDFSNTSTTDVGNIQGPQGDIGLTGPTGPQGPQGLKGDTGDTGPAGPQGNAGADGVQLTDFSVSTASASGAGALAYNDSTGVYTFTPPDLSAYLTSETDNQTINLSGSTLSISESNSNVDLKHTQFLYSNLGDLPSASSYHGAIAHVHSEGAMYFAHAGSWVELANASDIQINTDAQTLSLSGNVISLTGQSGNVDLTTLLAGSGGSSGDIDGVLAGTGLSGGGTTGTVSLHLNLSELQDMTDAVDRVSDEIILLDNGAQKRKQFSEIPLSAFDNDLTSSGISLTDLSAGGGVEYDDSIGAFSLADTAVSPGTYGSSTQATQITVDSSGRITSIANQPISGGGGGGGSGTSFEYFKINYTAGGAIDTSIGTNGISDKSAGIGNVVINNSASNSCEVEVDFGGNYSFPPIGMMTYGLAQATSEYNIKQPSLSDVSTTLKLDGGSNPHGALASAGITMSLTRNETGASSTFGQLSHAWVYFTMGS